MKTKGRHREIKKLTERIGSFSLRAIPGGVTQTPAIVCVLEQSLPIELPLGSAGTGHYYSRANFQIQHLPMMANYRIPGSSTNEAESW